MFKSTLKSFADFLTKRTLLAIIIVVCVGILVTLLQPEVEVEDHTVPIMVCNSSSVDSILPLNSPVVQPVIYEKVPDLKAMHYKDRMRKFIEMMLPSVLLAKEKMQMEQHRLLEINAAILQGIASEDDSLYLARFKKAFKTDKIEEVLKRMHPHPTSIILAQAAIESGWGTSRFCREANNIYGIWSYSYKEKRIRAGESRNGTDIYLRKYDSLFESIYDYLFTIAKANAYKQFREARLYSDNPYRLIWYLSNYSEMRYEYVRSLRNVIEFNDLHKYDEYTLAEMDSSDEVWLRLFR